MRAPTVPTALAAASRPPLTAEQAIQVLRDRLNAASRHGGSAPVPAEVLHAVLELVDGGAWDDFDGYRRWAGPWQPDVGRELR